METGTDEYYGLDTTVFKNEGFFAGFMNQLTGFYEDTGKDYISDLYSDALEDYFGGTVQVWMAEYQLHEKLTQFISASGLVPYGQLCYGVERNDDRNQGKERLCWKPTYRVFHRTGY